MRVNGNQSEREKGISPAAGREIKKYAAVLLSSFVFACSICYFITPLNLYSGGTLGVAQIIRTLINDWTGGKIPAETDIAGIVNFLLNIPLFILAFRTVSKNFFVKTLLFVILQAVFMTFIKIPTEPIVEDPLTNCIIGGIIGGVALGFTLRSSACGGGFDIIGVYMLQKLDTFSVGRIGIVVNGIIYLICAVLFDISTAIYSIIYIAIFMVSVDKVHYQNINVTCLIITRADDIRKEIMESLGRGVTCWKGRGGYTGRDTDVLVTVVNKYEEPEVKQIVKSRDPDAFVIFFEGIHVTGNFERRI